MRATVTDLICKDGTMTAELVRELIVVEDIVDQAYRDVDVPVDRLPYSSNFDVLQEMVDEWVDPPLPASELWTMLITRRKSGKLPRLNGSHKA